MKRIILSFCILTLSSSISYSQKIEDVGAGIINFLLRNPKTADRMRTDEKIALDIIADLLKTEGQRQHELEYAATGRNQITINTKDGRQAQFVKNESGKVFLLYDGVIYPVSSQLVNQANEIEGKPYYSTELEPIDLKKLKEEYEHGRPYYDFKKGQSGYRYGRDYYLRTVFPFKWWKDFNRNGWMDFEEIKQIKRTYYHNENFKIAIRYDVPANAHADLVLDIADDYSGKSYFRDSLEIKKETASSTLVKFWDIPSGILPVGAYIIYASLIPRVAQEENEPGIMLVIQLHATQKIQILEGDASTREISFLEENYRNSRITNSAPTGIFFWSSWNDLNSDGKYDAVEFIGLNKNTYSLTSDSIIVGVNFPQNSGEIILQSWSKQGKLLGTTTLNYQQIFTRGTFPASDPYKDMDFMDMIRISGPGEYRITVSFIDGGTFERRLSVTK